MTTREDFADWCRLVIADGNLIFRLREDGNPRDPRDYIPAQHGSGADRSAELLLALDGVQLKEVLHAAA